jgi:HipA-like C-terminal domain
MRPRNESARDQLTAVLRRRVASSAPELAAALDVSLPTLQRMLRERAGEIVGAGKARRTRYALRRAVRGQATPVPLYEVDAVGRAEALGALSLVQPEGSWLSLAGTAWPVPDESRDGWWPGLPYPLNDMRPQGYMGRQFALAEHRQLAVSADPREWGDDDVVHVLSQVGADMSGNLLLGNAALERWQAAKLAPPAILKARAQAAAYAALAERAIGVGVAGSSAAGEFPKFAALRERAGSATPHVLVKFSGAGTSAAERRWADLLVTEHLALECAAGLPGVASAQSRVIEHGGRTFLEVERFDRHGAFGRTRLVSLATVDAAFIGAGTQDWTVLAARLESLGLLAPAERECVQHLWWFGRLIANTDMHTGNLSFRPLLSVVPLLALAPTYDMLPMHYAPLPGGELPTRAFEPALPLPAQRAVWLAACVAAVELWKRAAGDLRISPAFRRICSANAQRLQEVAEHA